MLHLTLNTRKLNVNGIRSLYTRSWAQVLRFRMRDCFKSLVFERNLTRNWGIIISRLVRLELGNPPAFVIVWQHDNVFHAGPILQQVIDACEGNFPSMQLRNGVTVMANTHVNHAEIHLTLGGFWLRETFAPIHHTNSFLGSNGNKFLHEATRATPFWVAF